MTDILDVKRRLAASAASVAELLLPGGHKDGPEWRAGSVSGDKGQSLGVHLVGPKAGLWADFQSGEKGDLLDLWCAARGMSLPEALDAARSWLGITRPEPYRQPQQAYTRPPKPSCTAPKDRVRDYLVTDRNLPESVIERFKIGAQGNDIVFPFLLPDGVLAMAKVRTAVDGASPKPTAANCEPVLFGWQAMPDDAREVVITEGEIDAMSWAAYGRNAMSVPYGGGAGAKQKWIENEFDRLDRFEKIYISTDMDKVGDEAAEEIASRLGRHRCYRVALPRKDCNECLVDGVDQAEMDRAIEQAANLDPEGLRTPSDFASDIEAIFWPVEGQRQGYSTPFGKLGDKVVFRPAELSLWTGASGAGKSQVLSYCIVHWISQGSRVCLSSLEMTPAQTLRRMVKQAGNVDRPTVNFIRTVLTWLDQGLLLYEKVGKTGVDGLLEVFDYARAKYGCDQFVIDSLLRLGVAGDDYAGQEKIVFRLVEWSIRHHVHVHLVAHARKGERDAGVPGIEDVKGAMEIGANASNILAVWRNRRHEDETLNAETDEQKAALDDKPGVVLNVPKQRHGDFEGKIGLWFDQKTYRYHSSFDRGMWGYRYVDSLGASADDRQNWDGGSPRESDRELAGVGEPF